MSTKRVRQHTNPLRRELQVPTPAPVWDDIYSDPSLPLVADIGCGYGRFLIALAMDPRWQGHNMLGLDIRKPLMDRGNSWAERVCPGKVWFQFANATVSLDSVLHGYPGQLDLVTIQVQLDAAPLHHPYTRHPPHQYPDPQFKRRHRKRRMVQPQLVEALVRLLRPGGRLLLQSDVKEVAVAMRQEFESGCGGLLHPAPELHCEGAVFREFDDSVAVRTQQSAWAAHGWLIDNPLGLATEREIHSLEQGLHVYRMMLVKGETDIS